MGFILIWLHTNLIAIPDDQNIEDTLLTGRPPLAENLSLNLRGKKLSHYMPRLSIDDIISLRVSGDDHKRTSRNQSKSTSKERPRASRRRQPWPPSPSVEDEFDALAKETGTSIASEVDSIDGACMRGSVNQEPIMVEVQPRDSNSKPRGVKTGNESDTSKTPSNNSSDSEASIRGRQKTARLAIEPDAVPEFAQRTPSPYAFAPQKSSKSANRHSGEHFLSPETIHSPRTPSRMETLADYGIPTPKTTPRRTQEPMRISSTGNSSLEVPPGFSPEDSIDNVDLDNKEAARLRERRTSGRYSFTTAEPEAKKGVKFGGAEDGERQTLKFDPRDRPSSIRRQTDGAATLPRIPKDVKRTRPSPLQTTFASDPNQALQSKCQIEPNALRSPQEKRHGLGIASPACSQRGPLTPPESPSDSRHKVSSSESPRSARRQTGSASNSANDSASNSRSPSPRRMSQGEKGATARLKCQTYDSERKTAYSQAADHENLQRPSPPLRSGSMPATTNTGLERPVPQKASRANVVLPYPDDDVPMMPRHEDHVFSPTISKSPVDITPNPRSGHSSLPADSGDDSRDAPAGKPKLHARRGTDAETIPRSTDRNRPATSNEADKSGSAASERPLPPCPRAEPSSKFNEWYTIENAERVDICPDCLENVFLPSKYKKFFHRSPPRPQDSLRKCDFSSPWMRLAWLLTLKQKQPDLRYFAGLAEVAAVEKPCSGDTAMARSWYGLKDDSRAHVSGFQTCSACVSNVEVLLPSMKERFTRIPQSEPRTPRICELRTKNKHFATYLDLLLDIDLQVQLNDRSPEMRPFISFVREIRPMAAPKSISKAPSTSVPDCSRDNLLIGQRWYFMPRLPEFTVCKECYDSTVYPSIKARHSIAEQFHRKMHLASEHSLGASCQLYSPRMREVWRRVNERNDWDRLAQEVRDRRDTEVRLQKKHKQLRSQAEEVQRWSDSHQQKDELARLGRSLEKIADEWRSWE
jgi:hypothetical protein